jgi:hypothetical protein
VGKRKIHKSTSTSEVRASSLDALLAESRSLRRQMANDFDREARNFRRMSRHVARSNRSLDSDEQSA